MADDRSSSQGPGKDAERAAYLAAPAGEATRLALNTGGLVARQRRARLGWAAAAAVLLLLAGLVALDLAGYIEVPGVRAMAAVAGLTPMATEAASGPELSEEERERLRRQLLGGPEATSGAPAPAPAAAAPAPAATLEASQPLAPAERDLAASIFADGRKKESSVQLQPPTEMRVPNLPEGLTQDAIFSVITESSRALSLCIAQAAKQGERLDGRMEIEMTIGPSGAVTDAEIATAKFNGSTVGNCARTTVKRWRFPRFEGEPVTVVFPIVLSIGVTALAFSLTRAIAGSQG